MSKFNSNQGWPQTGLIPPSLSVWEGMEGERELQNHIGAKEVEGVESNRTGNEFESMDLSVIS